MTTNRILQFSLILQFIVGLFYLIPAQAIKPVTIIASGETHAMLDSCDCTDSPAGGFPKRSQLIKDIREKKEVLLLDAGGFAAGGIYDFYIEGRKRDSIRTLLAIKAMGAIGYEGVAIGDEELQYGVQWLVNCAKEAKLPVISANCRLHSGKQVTDRYHIVKKGSVTFGITAITSPEKLFPIDTAVFIEDPVKSLKAIWGELTKKSDIQVILSHLGEEQTQELADSFPDCEIFVNGHRKMSLQPVFAQKNQVIMQFGFQGKTLSAIDFDRQKKVCQTLTAQWLEVDHDVWDDLNVSSIVSRNIYDSIPKTTQIDLYIMSQCPYGIPAISDMLRINDRFSKIRLEVWFIGDINKDGSLRSLHGYQEIEEEKLWLAVQNLYPHLWYDFLYLCTTEGMPAPFALKELDLDTTRIFEWVEVNGENELACHYRRSNRLSIDASPTLFINNELGEFEDISYVPLAKNLCSDFPEIRDSATCASLPECLKNSDCRKKGTIGVCKITNPKRGGTCVFTDDVSFKFITVIPDTLVEHVETATIKTTRDLFPGAEIRTYTTSSAQGKKLISKYKPAHLPLYLFEKKVKEAANFSKIEKGLEPAGMKFFTFKPGVMKKHYFTHRKPDTSLVLYIDPLFPDIKNVVITLLTEFPELNGITVKPLIFDFNSPSPVTPEEGRRRDEALRWLVLLHQYGAKTYSAYLNSYIKQSDGSYWLFALADAAVNSEDFTKKVNENRSLLKNIAPELTTLEINGPVELICNNREVIAIRNQFYFKKIIRKLRGDTK